MIHEGVAERLGSVIEGLAYSEAGEGNVFVDHMPTTPDRAVGVYVSPGPESDSKLPFDQVAFQVVVRCESGGSAWALATCGAIYSALHGLRNTTLPGGVLALWILATQSSPFRLGSDSNGRASYSTNYRAEISNPTLERPA